MIDIRDPRFIAWFRELDEDTRIDLEVFWAREVKRHPFIKAHPETADLMSAKMLLDYAEASHGYEIFKEIA